MGGSHIGVHYNTGKAEAEEVAADIAQAGGKAILLAGDVAIPGTVTRLLDETVRQLGRLDILINNAGGVIKRCPVAETPDELFDRQVAVNIRPVSATTIRAVAMGSRPGKTPMNEPDILRRLNVAAPVPDTREPAYLCHERTSYDK